MLGGEAEQGLEGGHRRAPAVEAEDELVDVVWQSPGLQFTETPLCR